MKPKQQPVFLNVYKGLDGKNTYEEVRLQKETVDGVDKNVKVPNEQLPGFVPRNRKARRIVEANKRKR